MKNKFILVLTLLPLLMLAGCNKDKVDDQDRYKSMVPKNVVLLEFSNTSLTIAWDMIQGPTSYTVQLTDMDMNPYSENHIATVTNTDYREFTGLSAGQVFYGRVRSNFPYSGTSDWVYITDDNGDPVLLSPGVGILDLTPQLKLHSATSSTLTYEWSYTDDTAVDAAGKYNVELYKDEACTDLEVSWIADGTLTSGRGIFTAVAGYPVVRFTFSGLNPATTYYGRVTNTAYDIMTPVLSATTADAITPAAANNPAQTGDVVLSFDFSKFIHGGDIVNSSAGYNAVSGTEHRQVWQVATGVNPTDGGNRPVVAWNTEFNVWTGGTTAEYREALGVTDWGRGASGENLSTRPGYIKVGGGSAAASLFTPELTRLPVNSSVRVTFSACVYAEAANAYGRDVVVRAVDGATLSSDNVVQGGVAVASQTVDISTAVGRFETFTVTLDGLSPTSRIAFGSNTELISENKTRFLLDNIMVAYTGPSTMTRLDVPTNFGFDPEAVQSDKLGLKWDAVADAGCTYTLVYWADGTPEADATVVEGLTSTSYTLTGLTPETTYHAKIKACRVNNPDLDSDYSAVATQATDKLDTTTKIIVSKVAATSSTLAVEWERSDGQPMVNSADQVYRVAVYNDAQGQDLVIAWDASNVFATSATTPVIFRFTFSGLDPAHTYYISVNDVTNSINSDLIAYATTAAPVTASVNNPAQIGDVVLSEDFSNFVHGGDIVYSAAGYSAKANAIHRQVWSKALGDNPLDGGNRTISHRGTEFNAWSATTPEYREGLRMTNWGRGGSSHNLSTRPGYIKVGGSKGLATLFTPVLSTLPTGSTVKVSFSASAYTEVDKIYGSNIIVEAIDGADIDTDSSVVSGGTVISSQTIDISSSIGKFDTYAVTFSGVGPSTRISFGSDSEQVSANKTRFLLDDVVITVTTP